MGIEEGKKEDNEGKRESNEMDRKRKKNYIGEWDKVYITVLVGSYLNL